MPELPDHLIHDGFAYSVYIAEPCWLYAFSFTENDSGQSWWGIYRSVQMPADDEQYLAALDLVGQRDSLKSEMLPDPTMMFGRAELATYPI